MATSLVTKNNTHCELLLVSEVHGWSNIGCKDNKWVIDCVPQLHKSDWKGKRTIALDGSATNNVTLGKSYNNLDLGWISGS